MKTATLKLERDSYVNGTTLGKLYGPEGKYLCETLEDICRAWGIKHGGTTAIPVGEYLLTVSMSSKFKRKMVMVYTESNKYELKSNGISFKGIRIHGGNTNKDTWGCIIVAKSRTGAESIQGSQEANITAYVEELIKSGKAVKLKVINKAQSI
jgi:hypothetical protein